MRKSRVRNNRIKHPGIIEHAKLLGVHRIHLWLVLEGKRESRRLLARYRHAKMPPIRRQWYDIPLRASLVATLVATVVTLSGWMGPKISGIIALFPVVFTSMMLILHPRIGGPPTAAVLANSAWGLMGLGVAIAVLHVAALQFGSAIGLSLALATCVSWNLALWWNERRKLAR